MCVCITFVVFTDCESCRRPISTHPGSMEAGEYGLARGTCFIARRLEVVAVAGLLWISWCVLGTAGFHFFSRFFCLFERTRPAASMRPPCLIYLFTSILSIHAASELFSWTTELLALASGQFAPKNKDLSVHFIHSHFVQLPFMRVIQQYQCTEWLSKSSC